jgi:hypothetical protein
MIGEDPVDWSCEGQQRMVHQVLCILRGMFSMLNLILLPTSSFSSVIPVLYDCSLSIMLVWQFPVLQVAIAAG